MNSKLSIPLCTVTMLVVWYISGNRASMIRAHLHEDVLLACQGAYTGDFILEFLVITWQRSDNDAVVHSFYHERDQPQYQEEEFRGRTQLFPGDFHKGNASLLLKDVRESDAGSYTCHYIMYDKDAYTPQHLVLQVQSKDNLMVFPPDLHDKDNLMVFPPDLHDKDILMANSPDLHAKYRDATVGNNRRSRFWRLCLLPVPLIIACLLLAMFRKFRKYQKFSTPPEDQEALLNSSPTLYDQEALLNSSPTLYGAIESYRRKVLSTIERCCKSAFNEEGSEEEKDDCLPRIFHTMSGEMLHECSDKGKPHMGFAFKETEGTVQSEDLFTEKTLELISERMLISGDAGIGKSCFSKGLLKQWASGRRDLCYTCVIYMPFTELNAIEKQTSVRRLLESKCPELSPVLPELLVKEKILIILDGLDEFNHDLKDSSPPPDNTCDIDTPLDISTLITKVIYKELLPGTNVLVTSRLSYVCKIKESFTSAFRLEAFTEDQVKEYCEKFMPGNHISDSILDFIHKHNLSSLVSIPLLSSTLCQLYQKGDHSQDEGSLTTSSRLMFSLLQLSMKATLTETGHIDQIMPEKSDVPESIQNTIHQLCKMSYDNLINGVQEIKRKDLEVNNNLISGVLKTETKVPVKCSETDVLLKNLSEFFFKRDTKEDTFEYRHASIRDMFAALYCVMQIQEEKELEIFLNAFVFGEMLQDLKVPLLAKITSDHWKRFLNFIRFFFGLLSYKNNSLLSQPLSLSKDIKEFLKQWFQAWIEKSPQKMKFFNFLHCAFELQDPDLREDISHSIKNVNLFNIPLNSLDLKALCYCCHNSLLEAMDLRLCELRDAALEELQILIRMCKDVMLSSNKLSEKSGEILGSLLGDEKCAIEKLSLGTNFLGDSGTKHIFKGLENNKSLKFLSLTGNNISDLGTVSMAQSLKNNKTLKELRLCMNFFEHDGIININKLKRDRPDLKIVTRIAEDEEVLRYTEEKVKGLLSRGSNQYKMTWLVQLLQKVLKDLNDDENTHSCVENTVKERVQILKNNISQVLGRYETHQSTLKV